MSLTALGLSGALIHDSSAALYIDGKLIAAVEGERFVRDKHAKNRMPYESAKYCLEQAGIRPEDVGVVATPFAPISIFEKARRHYAKLNQKIIARHPNKPQWQKIDNVPEHIARIMAEGSPVAWLQGRSIIGCPSVAGVADRSNEQIKLRERWRSFCPSMLDTVASRILRVDHTSRFMTFTFEVNGRGGIAL